MTMTAEPTSSARAFALPNLLTYARIAAVPVVVGCMYLQSVLGYGLWLRWVALAIFIAAAITDWLDGYLARSWGQQSSFGRMLDPIADKAMVVIALAVIVGLWGMKALLLVPVAFILLREIPGVGPARKRALLQHFGTLKAIERASPADLAKVEGVSAEMAKKIYDFFHEAGR